MKAKDLRQELPFGSVLQRLLLGDARAIQKDLPSADILARDNPCNPCSLFLDRPKSRAMASILLEKRVGVFTCRIPSCSLLLDSGTSPVFSGTSQLISDTGR
jgi:hypothetical protein